MPVIATLFNDHSLRSYRAVLFCRQFIDDVHHVWMVTVVTYDQVFLS
jgi:hypothetical protein